MKNNNNIIKTSDIQKFIIFGGKTGALNWVQDCVLKNGTSKIVKRDSNGTYIVLDRKRHYFEKNNPINSSVLWVDMKESYKWFTK